MLLFESFDSKIAGYLKIFTLNALVIKQYNKWYRFQEDSSNKLGNLWFL